MKIHKTTDQIRIEILTDQETSLKLLKNFLDEKDVTVTPERLEQEKKARSEIARLTEKVDPDNRLTFIMSPLSAKQKSEVMAHVSTEQGKMVQSTYEMGLAAIRYSLKGVEGLMDGDKPYSLPLDSKTGMVSDEGLDVLLNLPFSRVLMETARKFAGASGVPKEIIDDRTGAPMPNVEVILSPKA